MEDFEKAVSEAGNSLVVVDIATTWCGPCKLIAPTFEALSEEFGDRASFYKLMGDLTAETAVTNPLPLPRPPRIPETGGPQNTSVKETVFSSRTLIHLPPFFSVRLQWLSSRGLNLDWFSLSGHHEGVGCEGGAGVPLHQTGQAGPHAMRCRCRFPKGERQQVHLSSTDQQRRLMSSQHQRLLGLCLWRWVLSNMFVLEGVG